MSSPQAPPIYGDPHSAFVAVLQAGNLQWPGTTINWQNPAIANQQPWFGQVPEPAPLLPFVSFDVQDSLKEDKLASTGVYAEEFEFEVFVTCLQQHVIPCAAPFQQGSVFHYLDSFRRRFNVFASYGQWTVSGFTRTSYVKKRDPAARAPGSVQTGAGGRVWVVSAKYRLGITVSSTGNYPQTIG